MNTRGCAFVILVLILVVFAWGILSVAPDLLEGFPEFSWPAFQFLPTLGPIQIKIPTLVGNLPPTLTPWPTATIPPTASAEILRNGRLLMLGFDNAIWSADVNSGTATKLGLMMESHIYSGNPWYSPDGRFALVAHRENDLQVAYLVHADGTLPDLRLGVLSGQHVLGGPQDFFGFSPVGQRFFYLDTSTNPANLIVVNLENFTYLTWPVQAGAEEITFVAFFGDGEHLLLKSYDTQLQAHYLEIFEIGKALSAVRRLIVREGYQVIQFVVSPNAADVAVVFRRFQDAQGDELVVVDIQTGTQYKVESGAGGRILLTAPAWSPDGKYLLYNQWQSANDALIYAFNSLDVTSGKVAAVVAPLQSPDYGEPLSRIASFAPDGLGAVVRLYDDVPGHIASVLVLLDGSYRREIGRAYLENSLPVGLYVAGFLPDWTKTILVEPQAGSKLGNMYLATLDGSQKELLDSQIPYEFFELGPVVSPDGQWVAYLHISGSEEKAALTIIRTDASGRREVFSGMTSLGEGLAPAGLPLVWLPAPEP